VEAQACGCPVFTSNRAPMTEVGGNAAVYFDPSQTAAAAETIIRHLPRVQEMRQAGLENAKRFRTEAMIAGYVALYQTLCPGRAPVRMAAAYLSSETGG
jgi:glycosyltransferase involved in cell wall biosynthesis